MINADSIEECVKDRSALLLVELFDAKVIVSEAAMMKSLAFVGLICVSLIGCGRSAQADSRPSASQVGERSATAEQWSRAVNGTFDKISVKQLRDKKNPAYVLDSGITDENGVTDFFACFDKAPPKCDLSMVGRRDNFRKILFFRDPVLRWSTDGAKYSGPTGKASIDGYISLKDCSHPKILLEPTFRGGEWLFIERLGIMADDSLVIDRELDLGSIEKENSHNAVSESIHIMLTDPELGALRKIVTAQQVLIRITGKKGYIGIDQQGTKAFVQGMSKTLRLYDALGHAIAPLGDVKENACAT
ncbi:hypothetical protein [Massilia endophytica]|uniref:hypothetical protein n=1 Tax=Massilia endophytica TaxID=2899220 RepID=UPI001E4A53E8|nr:hypothetical protein [Massilia endophytica]UGQ45095.1 hypothetical protein LSQ66_14980 [Massilia endophytica]